VTRALSLALVFALLVPLTLSAEGYPPSLWLDSPAAASYQGERQALAQLFQEAQERGLPGEILLEKLKEGAVKRAAPPLLVTALRAEMEREVLVLEALNRSRLAATGDPVKLLRAGSLLLQGGLAGQTLNEVLDYAAVLGKTAGRALEACAAAVRITVISGIEKPQLKPLSECLIRSSLKDESFSSLVSAALRAKNRGIVKDAFYRLTVGVLDSGGGIPAMDREIETRGRK